MALAILGLGTALPATRVSQQEAKLVARSVCCRTPEQATWLPAVYDQTGIEHRFQCLGRDIVDDVLHGTPHSGSIFLPTGRADDAGPTTGSACGYQEKRRPWRWPPPAGAGALALRAAELTHLVTVSCIGIQRARRRSGAGRWLELVALDRADARRLHGLHGRSTACAWRGAGRLGPVGARAGGGGELCILHYHYGWDPQKIIRQRALFADGAAASWARRRARRRPTPGA